MIRITPSDYRAIADKIHTCNSICPVPGSHIDEQTIEYDRPDGITLIVYCTLHTQVTTESADTLRGSQQWIESRERLSDISAVVIDHRPPFPVEDAPSDFDPFELGKLF